ncbi:MAG: DUF106 domain-containing protein [Candidatus Altiarchaeota archaeon]|nr:DUF106 domain-containing protein [Candidatus Altiarchaeota archaeon]
MIEITTAGYEITLISAVIVVMSSLVRRVVIGQDKMDAMKNLMKEKQAKFKEISKSGDMKRIQKAQEEMLQLTMENLKHSFKPMLITFIPIILVFGWLRDQYGSLNNVASLFGFDLSWFWWYFICAMVISLVFNKVLEVI